MWDKLTVPQHGQWGSQEESLVLIFTRAKTRTKRVLEHLFRAHSSEVLEAVVDCWHDQVLVSMFVQIVSQGLTSCTGETGQRGDLDGV